MVAAEPVAIDVPHAMTNAKTKSTAKFTDVPAPVTAPAPKPAAAVAAAPSAAEVASTAAGVAVAGSTDVASSNDTKRAGKRGGKRSDGKRVGDAATVADGASQGRQSAARRTERAPREPVDLTFPNGKPEKPNEEAFKTALERIDKLITAAKEERQAVFQKLEKFDSVRATLSMHHQEFKTEFDVLIKQRATISSERDKALEQIKESQASVKKQLDSVRNSRSKIGFNNAEDINKRIEQIDQRIAAGGLSLAEEKKLVQEITTLKRSRRTVEELSTVADSAKQAKESIDDIRKKATELGKERDAINKKIDALKETSNKKTEKLRAQLAENDKLYELRNKLSKTIKDSLDERDKLFKAQLKARDEFYAWQKVDYQRRQEQQRAKIEEEKKAKVLAKAQKALEEAEVPAYVDELGICSSLIDMLAAFSKEEQPASENTEPVVAKPVTSAPLSTTAPKNLTELKRDESDPFFSAFHALPGKKAKKVKNNNRQRFVLQLETVRLFDKIDVPCPASEDQVSEALKKIREKQEWYRIHQQEETLRKKAAAEQKIASLSTESLDALDPKVDDASIEKKDIVPAQTAVEAV